MVSVVIPLYNSKEYIVDAVKSVLKQDTALEIVVVDDASTDGSVDRLVSFLEGLEGFVKDADTKPPLLWQGYAGVDVRIYSNASNMGVAYSRNYGVKMSKGEYIAFLDADDIWAENKLKKQLKIMEKQNIPLCNTARYVFDGGIDKMMKIIHTPEHITLKELEHSNYINCSSVLMPREVALRYPMEHSDAHEDYLTWLRIMKDYNHVAGIDEPLVYYRVMHGSKSGNKLKSAAMTYRTYRYAGYGSVKAAFMMFSYVIYGINKYFFRKRSK